MISRFASWLKKGGILEFTTGDKEYQKSSSAMLNQELNFYSLNPDSMPAITLYKEFINAVITHVLYRMKKS